MTEAELKAFKTIAARAFADHAFGAKAYSTVVALITENSRLTAEAEAVRHAFGLNDEYEHDRLIEWIASVRHEARDYCNVAAEVHRLTAANAKLAQELLSARDEAYERAAVECDRRDDAEDQDTRLMCAAEAIRSLKSQPEGKQ